MYEPKLECTQIHAEEKRISPEGIKTLPSKGIKFPSKVRKDSLMKMRGAVYRGKKNINFEEVKMPVITDSTDAIIKITASSICGSDLHLYNGGIEDKYLEGSILGHEAVGVVLDLGSEVKNIKIGDRVVVSAVIACGQCEFCKCGKTALCEFTNCNKSEEDVTPRDRPA